LTGMSALMSCQVISLADPIFVLVRQRGNKLTPEVTKMIWIGFKVPSPHEVLARPAKAGYDPTRGDPGEGPMVFGVSQEVCTITSE